MTETLGDDSKKDEFKTDISEENRRLELRLAIIEAMEKMSEEEARELIESAYHVKFDFAEFKNQLAAARAELENQASTAQDKSEENPQNSFPTPVVNFGSGSVIIDDSMGQTNY